MSMLTQRQCLEALQIVAEDLAGGPEALAEEHFWETFVRDYPSILQRTQGRFNTTDVDFPGFKSVASQLESSRGEFAFLTEKRVCKIAGLDGTTEARHFGEIARLHRAFTGAAPAAANLAIILPFLASETVSSSALEMIPGRVLRVDVVLNEVQMVIFNVRNRGLSKQEVTMACEQIKDANRQARDNPFSFFVAVLGDFNFSIDAVLIFHRPETSRVQATHDHRVHAPVWSKTLGAMMEVCSDSPSHFCKHTNSVSRTGRFFCSAAGWEVCQLTVSAGTIDSPESLNGKVVSDRAAVTVALRQRAARPPQERPIPKLIFQSPFFERRLQGMLQDGDGELLSWSPLVSSEHYEEMMKETAGETRDVLFFQAYLDRFLKFGKDLQVDVPLVPLFMQVTKRAKYSTPGIVIVFECWVFGIRITHGCGLVGSLYALASAPMLQDFEENLEMAGKGAASSVNSSLRRTRVQSALNYVAQFVPMPPDFLAHERGVASQVLRRPLGMLSNESIPELQCWGGPRLPPWAVRASAALLRAAAVTFRDFSTYLDLMRARALDCRAATRMVYQRGVLNVVYQLGVLHVVCQLGVLQVVYKLGVLQVMYQLGVPPPVRQLGILQVACQQGVLHVVYQLGVLPLVY
ncbi:unnamed protein product [Prorocentrum cordatum]|uniref:Uncharacterized protein n=1 Tax=Prorocentrum cordatum TaxID=2364126 RepID=A0ABN9RNI9_9DINO|nr:unnamed protein product [Polarella glacialis]